MCRPLHHRPGHVAEAERRGCRGALQARVHAPDPLHDRLPETGCGHGAEEKFAAARGHRGPGRDARCRPGLISSCGCGSLEPSMPHVPTEIAAGNLTPARFQQEIIPGCEPVIIRGLVAEWPVVEAARGSAGRLKEYLAAFDAGKPVEVFF